jgi:hypothetical protein
VWLIALLAVPLVLWLRFKRGSVAFFLVFVLAYACIGRGGKEKQE